MIGCLGTNKRLVKPGGWSRLINFCPLFLPSDMTLDSVKKVFIFYGILPDINFFCYSYAFIGHKNNTYVDKGFCKY